LGFEQEIPHHSTFSKNRHGRFEESNLFQELGKPACGSRRQSEVLQRLLLLLDD
jgi:hypothetical protein